jgi:iron(III)-enterobactin esterase
MQKVDLKYILVEQKVVQSEYLDRKVTVDFYLPKNIEDPSSLSLLLINDGQNLAEMKFPLLLDELLGSNQVQPLLCVGIHAGEERVEEYATARVKDYLGRGKKAEAYQQFVLQELLPLIHVSYCIEQFAQKAFAGFSLGGLCALDMVWHYPEIFSVAGVFSGSLWWRSKGLEDDYNDDMDRIMHQQVRGGHYHPHLKFFFTTGSLDETADRNNNGIIDSIDDTLALIFELQALGYDSDRNIRYINYEDGRHDTETWGRALPHFLMWGWGRKPESLMF